MGYIRTKDGRIGTVTHEDNKNYRAKFGRKCPLVAKNEVIKSAETIEELCDRVVVKDSNNKEPRTYNPKKCNWKKIADTLFNERKVEWVKFAIWTDKGLIYVAKMNENGDIELL